MPHIATADDWLRYNLKWHASEHRKLEARCRDASARHYVLEPYHSRCDQLADAHAAAAALFESILGETIT